MSKSKKASVYLSAETMGALQRRQKASDQVNLSGGLNEMVSRYTWMVRASLPELDKTEWQTILNVYSGTVIDDFVAPARIASDMMDSVGAISLDALEPDYRALVEKTHAWSQAEQLAALDFVQQFWAKDWSGYTDFSSIAAEIKGR
jgi:hypothetical protein